MAYQEGCIFCAIAARKSPADLEFEDTKVVAFRDIAPKAPTHILIVPKDHLTTEEMGDKHAELLGHMILIAKKLAEERGMKEDGYRLVVNSGSYAGQVVDHIHLHLLGGHQLGGMG